jgi:hypothetical protein
VDWDDVTHGPANIAVKTAVSLYFGPTHGFDCSRNRAISVKYGVPVVSPFYGRELYNVGFSVPWYFKTPQGGVSKPLLRRVAIQRNLLPRDVAMLKKMGLGSSRQSLTDTQMGVWASHELLDWIMRTVRENLGLVDHLVARDLVQRMVDRNEIDPVFQILQFTMWYRRYFGISKVPLSVE